MPTASSVRDFRVGLHVNDGCFASGVAALLDVLGTADVVRTDVDGSIPAIETVLAGPKRLVKPQQLTVEKDQIQ